MEMFCKNLRNQAMKIINHEKKEMILLTNEETESLMKNEKFVIYAKKNYALIRVIKKYLKNIVKSEIIVIKQENLEETS